MYDAVVGRLKATKTGTAKTTGASKADMDVEGEEGAKENEPEQRGFLYASGTEQKSSERMTLA